MTTLSIYETRRLVLPIETVVEAVLQFDRDSGGTLFQGTILDATIETEPSPRLLLEVRRRSSQTIEHRMFTLPAIAAAIINQCRQARIPLPRNGKKLLEVVPEGFAFCIQTTINMPRWHDNWAQEPRKANSGAAVDTGDSEEKLPDASGAVDAA
jgi:hypothetical protein